MGYENESDSVLYRRGSTCGKAFWAIRFAFRPHLGSRNLNRIPLGVIDPEPFQNRSAQEGSDIPVSQRRYGDAYAYRKVLSSQVKRKFRTLSQSSSAMLKAWSSVQCSSSKANSPPSRANVVATTHGHSLRNPGAGEQLNALHGPWTHAAPGGRILQIQSGITVNFWSSSISGRRSRHQPPGPSTPSSNGTPSLRPRMLALRMWRPRGLGSACNRPPTNSAVQPSGTDSRSA